MVGAEHNVFAMLCPLNMQDQERPPKKRVFEIEKYREDPDNPGRYLKTGRATYKELFLACQEMLEGEGLLVEMDYFSASWKDDPDNRKDDADPLPDDYKWVSSFAVTGGSEGWYIHVEMIMRDGRRELVCLGKILTGGISKAYQIAGELARFLQA